MALFASPFKLRLPRPENALPGRDDVLLVNRRSGLLIDEDCEKSARPESDQYPRYPATASDDKLFRLARMPVEACR